LDTSNEAGVTNFSEFVEWIGQGAVKQDEDEEVHYLVRRQHDRATIKAAARRLRNVLAQASGILRLDSTSGQPPEVVRSETTDPIVIDIDGLDATIQRFIVAAIVERIKRHRAENAERRQRYLIVLDELNRFAPKGGTDEISKLFEHVAAQLRSQGILLFGAQQKASSVSTIVWENAATKALGRTGAVELAAEQWRQILPGATRTRAAALQQNEKIILQDGFNYPMLTNIPMTPWATRRDEIGQPAAEEKSIADSLVFEEVA
jgi:DNA helicase HerA-like ATPase